MTIEVSKLTIAVIAFRGAVCSSQSDVVLLNIFFFKYGETTDNKVDCEIVEQPYAKRTDK